MMSTKKKIVMMQKKQRKIDKKRKDVLQPLTRITKILDAVRRMGLEINFALVDYMQFSST